MTIVQPKNFESLRPAPYNTEEPTAKEVGVHELSRKIAHKTKFRVVDVEEVVTEACYALYAMLLERKSVNLNGLYLQNRWNPLVEPRYVRNEDGYWTFGYFSPKIEFDTQRRMMFIGQNGVYRDDFMEKILPYLDEDIEDSDDLRDAVLETMKETSQLGKNILVDEDGMFLPKGKTKKRFFDEDFHPTFGEISSYNAAKRRALRKYWEKKRSGEEPDFIEFIKSEIESEGFTFGSYKDIDEDEGDEEDT